jgi:hypothetical protein
MRALRPGKPGFRLETSLEIGTLAVLGTNQNNTLSGEEFS